MWKLIPVQLLGAGFLAMLVPASARAADVNFVIQPGYGQAMMADVDAFMKCQRRHIDPWNRAVCTSWEILSAGTRPILGQFCIQAQWGIRSFRGNLNVPPNAQHPPYVITPQPPSVKGTCV